MHLLLKRSLKRTTPIVDVIAGLLAAASGSRREIVFFCLVLDCTSSSALSKRRAHARRCKSLLRTRATAPTRSANARVNEDENEKTRAAKF